MTIWRQWIHHPQTVWLRKAVFQIHLWTGMAVGLYVFAICLSGSVLVYRNELYTYFSPKRGGPVPAGFRATTWLIDFHDNLLSGATGRSVNGAGGWVVMLLAVTGAVVWWPGIRQWRRSLTIDRRSKRFAWTLHSALGFWFLPFILMWGVTGAFLSFQGAFGALFDYLQPFDPAIPGDRLVDQIQYWLAYIHFGRLGGRGIPGCGRGICDSVTKFIWAAAGLVPPVIFVTGALMWWTRAMRRAPGISPSSTRSQEKPRARPAGRGVG